LSEQIFLNLVGSVLTIIFGVLSGFVSNYFKEAKNVKQAEVVAKVVDTAEAQIQSKRGLAYDAVMFVEDAFKDAGGEYKLARAINWAINAGKAHGLELTADGIEGFVRSQYNELKVDLAKVVPGAYDVTTPASGLTPVDADSEPVAPAVTADQTPVNADPVVPVEVAPVDTVVPTIGPDVQAQLTQAMVKVNAAQAEYNQLVQQVADTAATPV
jgi:hypothetical protein